MVYLSTSSDSYLSFPPFFLKLSHFSLLSPTWLADAEMSVDETGKIVPQIQTTLVPTSKNGDEKINT